MRFIGQLPYLPTITKKPLLRLIPATAVFINHNNIQSFAAMPASSAAMSYSVQNYVTTIQPPPPLLLLLSPRLALQGAYLLSSVGSRCCCCLLCLTGMSAGSMWGTTPPWLMTALCSRRDSSASPLMASCRCLQPDIRMARDSNK
jgi:hypothetical protein